MEPPISSLELLLRIFVAAFLGGVIGYERDLHGRPVGLRTHVLVAMGSATFMVVSAHFAFLQGYEDGHYVEVDTSRIAASVVSGIGFLAGGSILRTGSTIQGLTTAAGLWVVTSIGLAAGSGMYVVAGAVTGSSVLALTVLRRFEDKDIAIVQHRISLVASRELELTTITDRLKTLGAIVSNVEIERRTKRSIITLDVALPRAVTVSGLMSTLEELSDVRRVAVRRPL